MMETPVPKTKESITAKGYNSITQGLNYAKNLILKNRIIVLYALEIIRQDLGDIIVEYAPMPVVMSVLQVE